MYRCCYVLSEKNKQYFTQLANCGCVEGDKTELLTQVKDNKNFCRDQLAINYNYFVYCLTADITIIYIQNVIDNKILGACSINLDRILVIYSMCVPDNGIKGIGTLLLDNIKCIGKLIDAERINLAANSSVREFYIKNGFTIDDDDNDDDDDHGHGDDIGMTYNFKQTLLTTAKGGTRKSTSQKKNKSRYNKSNITKKSKNRNKKISKRGKTNKK